MPGTEKREIIPVFPGLLGHMVPAEDQVGELCDGKSFRMVRRALN